MFFHHARMPLCLIGIFFLICKRLAKGFKVLSMTCKQQCFFSMIFLCLIWCVLPQLVVGQGKKAGQESCDGALDVVPSKAVTFQRKRRPANARVLTPALTPSARLKHPRPHVRQRR